MFRDIAKSESTIHYIIAALSVVLLILAIIVAVKKYRKSERFQIGTSDKQQKVAAGLQKPGCKSASDAVAKELCTFGASSVSTGRRKQLFEGVMDTCGNDFPLGEYLYKNYSNCPITATDLILGGTHDLAFRPVQLIPELTASDIYTNLTKWGLYQWKDEGKAQGTVTQL